MTGGKDGRVIVYDTRTEEVLKEWKDHEVCASGVALHPSQDLVAMAYGERQTPCPDSDDEKDTQQVNALYFHTL